MKWLVTFLVLTLVILGAKAEEITTGNLLPNAGDGVDWGSNSTDQEQFMLLEDLYKTVEKIEIRIEDMMHNKVNIEFVTKQLEKALADIEIIKDKVRANGSH